jgi:DNA-binding response OmpR family regulator
MAIVALLDRDPLQARVITDNLEAMDHTVLWSRHEWEALLAIHRVHPDLIIVDCALPQWYEFVTVLRKMHGQRFIPLILIAAHRPPPYYLRKLTVAACLDRHFDAEALAQLVQHLLIEHRLAPAADFDDPPDSGRMRSVGMPLADDGRHARWGR